MEVVGVWAPSREVRGVAVIRHWRGAGIGSPRGDVGAGADRCFGGWGWCPPFRALARFRRKWPAGGSVRVTPLTRGSLEPKLGVPGTESEVVR